MARVIISGGGTGGHVFPAIAIADAIKSKNPATEILFVGANGKIEMEKVPSAGYKIIGLNVVGFQRKLTLKNLLFPFKLIGSMFNAYKIVKNFKPDIAVGVGGYASGPILKMANLMNIKTVLQEQNSYAGVTNKLLASKAEKIFVAYDNMERFFPKDKLIFTGNPIRKDILDKKSERIEANTALGFNPEHPTILIFGGSLGARTINNAILSNADRFLELEGLNIYWQVGKLYYDEFKDCKLSGRSNIKIASFIENMDTAYSAADLIVCRAGALTISEIAVLGKASILIPSPNVAEDHQTVNAMSLVKKDAAIMVKDIEADMKIFDETKRLLDDENLRKSLEQNIKYFGKPDAAIKIADEILKIC